MPNVMSGVAGPVAVPTYSEGAAPAHPRSEGNINPALRVFKVPPTDISINAYRMVTIQPTTNQSHGIHYSRLGRLCGMGHSYFTMELSLKKSDNGNLVANEKFWPVNNLAHAIIKQIDLQLNGTLISPQSDTYHYKAYLENLLNFDREDGKTVLGPQGWFNQVEFPPQWTANNTNSTTPHVDYRNLSANHKGALAASVAETRKYAGGVTHSLVFTPHLEVFHTSKVLVPGVEIKMKFHFNCPNLFLNGVALAGRLMERDVKLRFHLCQLRLNETVYRNLSVQRHNAKQMATYPTVRSEIRTFSMQGNLTRFDIPNLFQNRVPDRLIVAVVDSRNFNGDVTRDPLCFQKFGLSSIRQIVRGEEYPYETLRLAHNNATRDNLGYFRFLQASGAWCKKKGNMVELGDWGEDKNCTLFIFDNVANGCADSQKLNPKQTGDLQLSLEFGAAPNTNITVLVYGEFENLL